MHRCRTKWCLFNSSKTTTFILISWSHWPPSYLLNRVHVPQCQCPVVSIGISDCLLVKVKKRFMGICLQSSQHCRNSHVKRDHAVLPATRQRRRSHHNTSWSGKSKNVKMVPVTLTLTSKISSKIQRSRNFDRLYLRQFLTQNQSVWCSGHALPRYQCV